MLDWGRGVWTYKNTWYWGSASGLVDGERFGFNIGYGFGNTSAASENMLFYKGRAHKLSQVIFHIPGDGGRATPDYMRPWTFTSDDGRFEMDYTPVLDRASCSAVVRAVFGCFVVIVTHCGGFLHFSSMLTLLYPESAGSQPASAAGSAAAGCADCASTYF